MSFSEASPTFGHWVSTITPYGDAIFYTMLGVISANRREYSSHITKLLVQKDFKNFCRVLNPKLYTSLQRRFIEDVRAEILIIEMFGNNSFSSDSLIGPESAMDNFARLYAGYLSAVVAGQDPFAVDVTNFRDGIKSISELDSKHRFIRKSAFADIDDALKNDSGLIYKTKWRTFNFFFSGGLRSRRLYTIGGAPGVGKSGMLLNFFVDACLNGVKATYITLENSVEETQRRVVAHLTSTDLSRLYADCKGMEEEIAERRVLSAAKEALIDQNGAIIDSAFLELREIRAELENNAPKVLILDYLNLVAHKPFRDTPKDLEDLTISLARLAKEFDCAIITACQLNRSAIVAIDPDETNVGDSFGIVKASDVFFTLYQYKLKDGEASEFPERQMVLKIAKSRFSGLGQMPIYARKEMCQFNEV